MRPSAALASIVLIVTSCSGSDNRSAADDGLTSEQTPAPAAEQPASPTFERSEEREEMVQSQLENRGVADATVLEAMRAVPRHRFVTDEFADQAYDDHPLPIGFGQTISQPYIVGLMSSVLDISPGDRVLEIGTGSGYQAAVLAQMGMEVYTIEIIPELAQRATGVLAELDYDSVTTRQGDGYFGWEDAGPFDAIIVTAAPDHVPQPLAQQLAPGGRMVIPIGPVGAFQTLWVFEADESGELLAQSLGAVAFVAFTGEGVSG
jgi:protein-L-isoaspartate(D-aspartate) O-methyltransferase